MPKKKISKKEMYESDELVRDLELEVMTLKVQLLEKEEINQSLKVEVNSLINTVKILSTQELRG